MLIFMFLLLPLVLCFYCFSFKENRKLPVICIGIMSAVIVCAIRMIFFFPHRVVPFSFEDNLIFFLIKECFLPAVILYVAFFIISRDPVEYKVRSFFPLEISFYMVYFPFALINSSSGINEPFSLIIKPILYVCMFAAVGILAYKIMIFIREKRMIWLACIFGIIILVYMVGPAVIESFYLMNTELLTAVIFSICYIAFPCCYGIIKVIKIFSGQENNSSSQDSCDSFFDKYKFDNFDKLN